MQNYSITLVVDSDFFDVNVEDIIEEILAPWRAEIEAEYRYAQLESEYAELYAYTIEDKNCMFARYYSRIDKQRRPDNKRHKKPRYFYHKARV